MAQEMITIEGTVETVVFYKEESGFAVLEVSVGADLVTLVGETASIGEGEQIRATGEYTSHPTYGRQFRAQMIELVLPAGSAAILRFLSTGTIKGVGPAIAKRIVDKFGDETLEIFESEPLELAQVKGINLAKAEQLGREYQKILGVRSIMAFLSAHGVSPATAIGVWKKWGTMAQSLVSNNPYVLCDMDIGVPFEQADTIASDLGFDNEDPCRVKGGVLHVLTHNLSNGHSCLPLKVLAQTAGKILEVPFDMAEDAIAALCEEGQTVAHKINLQEFIYLSDQYKAETYCVERLSLLISFSEKEREVTSEELSHLEEELEIKYATNQIKAINGAISSSVMILTGGPGTGKTTTLNGIITLLERRGMKVALAAPTGRAAKRLTELTSREAKTIHRLLEVDFGSEINSPKFKRNERNPLAADVVVIDEMSMVDIKLFASLLKSLRMSSRIIMVGDPDQLPSVGAGNVLRDLIDSGMTQCVHLDEVFRQAAESLIVTSAHKIVKGNTPELNIKDKDFFFLPRNSGEDTAATIVDLTINRLPKAYGLSPTRDIQVLSPSRAGITGTAQLNRMLQKSLNPPQDSKIEHLQGDNLFREGDKVMQIKNNYDILWGKVDGEEGLGIFNGDIGYIEMINKPSKSMLINFEDRKCLYTFDMLNEIELAYAITIHKSQGSEFDAVIIPLFAPHSRLSYRNLLYTAVTRAKKLLIIVGREQRVSEMVENNRKTLRYTLLTQRLMECATL